MGAGQKPLLPILRSLFSIYFNQFSFTMSNIVFIRTGRNITTAKCVHSISLFDSIYPFPIINSFVFFVGIFSFSLSNSIFPLTIIDIAIGVCVFALAMFFVILILSYILETIRL